MQRFNPALAFGLPIAVGALLLADPARATLLNTNILINGDAEAGVGSGSGNDVLPIPGWSTTSNFTVVQYGAPAFPTIASSTSTGGGVNFFAGGPNTVFSSATQTIVISDLAASIDAASLSVALSGYLGGFDGQDDNMTVTATFLNAALTSIGAISIGPVTQPNRAGLTELLPTAANGAIPVGTRSIRIEMDAVRVQGAYDDGYADNLSLILSGGSTLPVAVPEPATLALLWGGLMLAPLSRLRRQRPR